MNRSIKIKWSYLVLRTSYERIWQRRKFYLKDFKFIFHKYFLIPLFTKSNLFTNRITKIWCFVSSERDCNKVDLLYIFFNFHVIPWFFFGFVDELWDIVLVDSAFHHAMLHQLVSETSYFSCLNAMRQHVMSNW